MAQPPPAAASAAALPQQDQVAAPLPQPSIVGAAKLFRTPALNELPANLLPGAGAAASSTYRGGPGGTQSTTQSIVAPGLEVFERLATVLQDYSNEGEIIEDKNNPGGPDLVVDIGFSKIHYAIPWRTETLQHAAGLWLYRFALQYAAMAEQGKLSIAAEKLQQGRTQSRVQQTPLQSYLSQQLDYFQRVNQRYWAVVDQRMTSWLDTVVGVAIRGGDTTADLLDKQIIRFAGAFHLAKSTKTQRAKVRLLREQRDNYKKRAEQLAERLDVAGEHASMETESDDALAALKYQRQLKKQLMENQLRQFRARAVGELMPSRSFIEALRQLAKAPSQSDVAAAAEERARIIALTARTRAPALRPIVPSDQFVQMLKRLASFDNTAAARVVAPPLPRGHPIVPSNQFIQTLRRLAAMPVFGAPGVPDPLMGVPGAPGGPGMPPGGGGGGPPPPPSNNQPPQPQPPSTQTQTQAAPNTYAGVQAALSSIPPSGFADPLPNSVLSRQLSSMLGMLPTYAFMTAMQALVAPPTTTRRMQVGQ